MRFHESSGDRETESEAAGLATVAAVEFLKDPLRRFRRKPRARDR